MKKTLFLLVLMFLSSIGDLSSSGHNVATRPPLLKNKDKIAIVAPASRLKYPKNAIEKAT
jgi:hypothetical protein